MKIIPFPVRANTQVPPITLSEATERFAGDLQTMGGRRPLTLKRHVQELRHLARWLDQERMAWHTVQAHDLHRYIRSRSHLQTASMINLITTLRVFYTWAVEEKLVGMSPVADLKSPQRPKSPPRALTRSQVHTIIAWLFAQKRPCARRDELVFLIALYAGLRRSELAKLDWSMIDLADRVITIPLSKMNRGRVIVIHPSLTALLDMWRIQQGQGGRGAVFDWQGKGISADRVGKLVKRTSQRCGIEFTPHVLRHTFSTWANRIGRDINSVSKALGHQELKQTMVYVAADPEDSRRAVESLPDLNDW